jgi:hypothetical protein
MTAGRIARTAILAWGVTACASTTAAGGQSPSEPEPASPASSTDARLTERWPDAFPKEDIAVRRALGGVTPAQADAMSQAWRPWRGYALLHLWSSL